MEQLYFVKVFFLFLQGMRIKILPSILFTLAGFTAGFLLLLTPETKKLPLFDTIAQIEDYKIKVMSQKVQEKNNC